MAHVIESLQLIGFWSSIDLSEDRGYNDVWDTTIYPGMKRAVISALICCQDIVEQRKNAFELYGADFMLTEDCHPWLIEINSSPCMAPSTQLTAKMCPAVLEDTLRVVIDRKTDKNANTGMFELAYRQPVVAVPQYIGMNLQVEGMAIKKLSFGTQIARKMVDDSCDVQNRSQSYKTAKTEKLHTNVRKVVVSPAVESSTDTDSEVDITCKQTKNEAVTGISKPFITRQFQPTISVHGRRRRKKRGVSRSGPLCTNEGEVGTRHGDNSCKTILRQQSDLGNRSRLRTIQDVKSKIQFNSTALSMSDAELTTTHVKRTSKVATAIPHGYVTIANIPNIPTMMLKGSINAEVPKYDAQQALPTTRVESKRSTTGQSKIPLSSTTETRLQSVEQTNSFDTRSMLLKPISWSSGCHNSSILPTVFQSDEPVSRDSHINICSNKKSDFVRASAPLPTMPYFPFKPFGSRRSWLWPDDSVMFSKLKYSHSAQPVEAPRDRRFPPRQTSVNIVVLGSSLSAGDN